MNLKKRMYHVFHVLQCVYAQLAHLLSGSLEITRDHPRSLELRREQRRREAERDDAESDQRAVDADGDHARRTCEFGSRVL